VELLKQVKKGIKVVDDTIKDFDEKIIGNIVNKDTNFPSKESIDSDRLKRKGENWKW